MFLSVGHALTHTVHVIALGQPVLTRGRLLVSISFSMLHLLWALLATRVAWVLLILQVVLCQFRRMLAAVMLRSRVIVVLRRCEIAVLVILVSATWHW